MTVLDPARPGTLPLPPAGLTPVGPTTQPGPVPVAQIVPMPVRPGAPRMLAVGTANPETSYSQQQVLDAMGITDHRITSVFLNSAIDRRYLQLPPVGPDGVRHSEVQGELLAKHKRSAVEMAVRALTACLADAGAELSDVRYLGCITSTGFLTPGLSALVIRAAGLEPTCSRADIVGMGCNAGLNGLNAVSAWSTAHPGELAVMICTEACSAAYAFDSTMRTAVVNSLFGDGAAAVALRTEPDPAPPGLVWGDVRSPGPILGGEPTAGETSLEPNRDAGPPAPRILKFSSYLITDAMDAMRYDWDQEANRFSFFLDPAIPYVVGANAERVVDRLLVGTGLRRREISHWLVHSGGKKVIDAVQVNLGLTRHDVRHTIEVLRDFGNLSSGSFLFSYQRLLAEQVTAPGDYGVLMTMGPGSTIETALVQW